VPKFRQLRNYFGLGAISKTLGLLMILVLTATTVLGAGCASTPATSSFKDDLGRAISIKGVPQRIVSLAPSNTEILFALGLGNKVVGVDDSSDYPTQATALPQVGDPYPNFNIETIESLKPDLALAFSYTLPDYASQLENLGIPVVVLAPKDVSGVISDINLIGQITGSTAQAKTLTDGMQQSLDSVEAKLKGATTPSVFWEFDGTDPGNPWTAGPGSFNDALITLAGGQNIGASGPTSSWQMSSEDIIKADPQVIILDDYQFGITVDSVAQRPGWDLITAVKNNAVYPITDPDLTDRPGPRIIDGLELLAKLIHPELFS
jgi:iron complex transport system substrate-binding protein